MALHKHKAEQALKESEERFRMIFDGSRDAIFIVAEDAEFVEVNEAASALTGYSQEELKKMTISDLHEEEDTHAYRQFFHRIMSGEQITSEARILRKDGTKVDTELSNIRITIGDVAYMHTVARDITERKKAEETARESEKRFHASVENMLDCFGIYSAIRDESGHIVDFQIDYVNAAACANNLMTKDEQIGKRLCELLPAHRETGLFDEYCQVVETGRPLRKESLIYEDVYGSKQLKRAFGISAVKLGDGFAVAWCDITERKKAEEKQDELLEKVDNINKELKEFAYIVSHDLKAPLRGIKTLASWILSDCADKLGDQANKQMNLLLERVERMYNLIEGTLQYSRAGRAEGKRVQINLNNYIPEIIDMVVPPENITVTIENELPVIVCEENHIIQVFQNLLSNAIKYMDKPQGRIKVGCVEQDGFWKFSVADNGPGIEENHFENIFKIFQALPISPDFQGTGVGLTVAKKIVELYDGKIWVESKVGEGSCFLFTLPKQKMGVKNEKLEANIAC